MMADNEDLGYFVPEEGTNRFVDALVIPKGSSGCIPRPPRAARSTPDRPRGSSRTGDPPTARSLRSPLPPFPFFVAAAVAATAIAATAIAATTVVAAAIVRKLIILADVLRSIRLPVNCGL